MIRLSRARCYRREDHRCARRRSMFGGTGGGETKKKLCPCSVLVVQLSEHSINFRFVKISVFDGDANFVKFDKRRNARCGLETT